MKGLLLCLITSILFISCGSYQHSSYKVKSVLAITEAGDTIAVPIREFERTKYDSYTRFNYNNNWYWNNWRFNQWNGNWWIYNNPSWWSFDFYRPNLYVNPNRSHIRIPNRPKRTPRVEPRPRPRPRIEPKSYMQGPRGGRSYNNPSRTNTTPNVSQSPRPSKSNYNTGRKNN